MLAALLAAGSFSNVLADEYGHEKSSCYTAYEKQPGVIHFKVLVSRKAGDSKTLWLSGASNSGATSTTGGGKIFISRPGHDDECIIRFYSCLTGTFADHSGRLSNLSRIGWKADKGTMVSTTPLTGSYSHTSFNEYTVSDAYVLTLDEDEKAVFAEWDWYMPVEYIGSGPSSFKVSIECKGLSPRSDGYYYYSDVKNNYTYKYTLLEDITIPDSQPEAPQLMEPSIAMDMGDGAGRPGIMLNIVSPENQIYSYTLPDEDPVKMATPNNFTTVYIPASDMVHKNYRIGVKGIYNGEEQQISGNAEECYNFYDAYTNTVDIPAYHMIHNMKSEWYVDSLGLRNGDVRVTWDIYNPYSEDIMEDDIFIVERATRADYSDAEQVYMESYESGKGQYEFIDQSDDVKRQNTEEGTFHYRVRRASTSMWTDMDGIVESGLAAISSLRYAAPKTTADTEAEIIEGLYSQTIDLSLEYDFWDEQFTWKDSAHFDLTFISTIDLYRSQKNSLALDFHYRTGNAKAIYQPVIGSCTAAKASDWATSRRVEVSAVVPYVAERYLQSHTTNKGISIYDRDHSYYKYQFSPSLEPVVREPEENNTYWDTERTVLYLVRRMISGNDTTEIETPVPADCIMFNTETGHSEVHTSDVADVPCTRYEYYFRIDSDNTPLPVGGEKISSVAESDSQFYFSDGISMGPIEASDRTSPDFTVVQWETLGGEFEQYEIWRTSDEEGTQQQWTCIATVAEKSYLDRTAPVGVPCLYKVVGLLDCDESVSDTSIAVHGQRDCYGSISGYVTYTNGSVRPGTEIHIVPSSGSAITVTTDENGYYHADGLLFTEDGTSYQVLVPDNADNAYLSASGAHLPLQITLNGKLATIADVDIQYTQCQRMEGRVLYEHSTVPVPHVRFLLDGRLLKDRSGNPLETDASGNFDLMVESGKHTIRAVKDGHTFANDGFFTDEEGNTAINFTGNLYGKRLYDITRIRVAGRITGGLTEGSKPLGLGRSTNTLGDNLTLVLELEGDNTSRFVYYPNRSDIIERDTVFQHPHQGDSTMVHEEARRITIHPDPRTGEFIAELFPARYKITQAYANGYATLFAAGMTSQAFDMSDATHIEGYIDTVYAYDRNRQVHIPYNYRYQITYRNPISLNCEQLVYGMPKDYMGDETMRYDNIFGTPDTISLVKRDASGKAVGYVFGYPVFSSQNMRNKYTYRISATEDYFYNNEQSSSRHWKEYVVGQEVTLTNGMSTDNETHRAYIDPATRYATIAIEVNNPSFVLAGEKALRQIEIGMEVDGRYIYAQPIQGFVSGSRAKGVETVQELNDELTLLDVIRDPYGANSFSYVEAGTSYHASYRTDWDVTAGLNLRLNTGPDKYQLTGGVAAPGGVGTYWGTIALQQKTQISSDVPIQLRFVYYDYADYIFTTSERIQTSSDPQMVGAMADIYIGTMHHRYAGLIDAVSIIDSTQYRLLQPAIESGKVHLLAMPQDNTPYYLVVGEQAELGITRPVEFAYTQKHIVNNVLPRLIQSRDELLMTGSHDELQAVANATDACVYRSLVDCDDPLYGLDGGYEFITPERLGIYVDDVKRYNNLITQWIEIIAANEKTKIEAIRLAGMKSRKIELLNTYSITSGADISYKETTVYTHAMDWHHRYTSTGSGLLAGGASFGGQLAIELYNIRKQFKLLEKGKEEKSYKFTVFGYEIGIEYSIIADADITTKGTSTFGNSKTAGFVLSASDNSYEDISVYRLTDDVYNSENEDTYDKALSDVSNSKVGGEKYADYVFIREGGATHCPYEGEESTLFYTTGSKPMQLAAPTLHIDRPTLSINVHELSNVPMDQPATFVLTISNESDLTYDPNIPAPTFLLRQDQNTNPDGLVIKVDGQPVMNDLMFPLKAGESIQKTMQVYRGTAYDYEDIRLILRSDCDINLMSDISFNVHFQPVSCPVSMTLPVQNWIMNTLSPNDENGYYLPVEISGFDIHYDNFDHIDLQYKLQTQSDDQWTTQCSFYADSALYERASGNKAMIENGQIRNVRFYGERDPMEQRYDLRAVSYCRFGNDFITRASELRSGLKDTRLPQLFGVATPANGILQVGDYISIPYSENIAANYLDEDYNFEVVGYTNQSEINRSTSITFAGDSNIYAMTELSHNLSKKDFSVDMWVMPARRNQEMTYIMQGNRDTYIGFGQSYNPETGINRLGVHMADPTQDGYMLSEPINITTDEWMHVVATYCSEDGSVELYLNGKRVTTSLEKYPPCLPDYAGVGPVVLGAHPAWPESYFEGRILEARIWDKVLSAAEIEQTNLKQISGYENALAAYYPFDEGQGTVAVDKVGGTNLLLNGVTWTKQEGRALELDGTAISLDGNHFNTGARADFTYSMWFRIMEKADSVNLFDAGSMRLTLTPSSLKFVTRVAGTSTEHDPVIAQGGWMDQQWHFLAVTANHSTGVGKLYVDDRNVGQFVCNDVQASDSDSPVIGPMHGQIDDITFWEMALPEYYCQNFYRHTPNNSEMGLLVHLGFSERVLSDDGDHYSTQYSPYNERIRKDELGNVLPRTEADRVVITDSKLLKDHLVDNAPVHEKGDLVKLGFNWIGKDNELVINLKTNDKEINKQNVFITVRNVEDLAGNPQQSPLCWTLFVDRNSLRWSQKYLQASVSQGESGTLNLDILNQGGTVSNYYIEQLPWWLTASSERGELSPLEQSPLTLRISDKLDPGEYDAIIYLTDDNELTEPLRIRINVKARQPGWNVNTDYANGQTMNLFAQVQFVGAKGIEYFDTDTADIVSAYLGNTCIGVEHIMMQNDRGMLYMSLQGSNEPSFIQAQQAQQAIRFLLWRASTGKIYALNPTDDSLRICYSPNTWTGQPNEPVILRTTDYRTQQIDLQKGWNWISFYITPDNSGSSFSDILNADYMFNDGDFIKWSNYSQSYEAGEWHGMPMQFSNRNIYMVRVSEKGHIGVQGYTTDTDQRYVNLRQGWNNLPYINEYTQDINTALSSYRMNGKPGDVVKGYHTFAMLDENRQWVGSLTHLQPGMGYMLYRQDKEPVVLQYQSRGLLSDNTDQDSDTLPENVQMRYSNNMPIVATVENAAPGEILMAYEGDMLAGSAEADENGRFMLMTSAEEGSMLSFRHLSSDGEKCTAPVLRFQSGKPSAGTLEQPYLVTFDTDMASAYPNPFTDHINYSGITDEDGSISVSLYNSNGICIWTHTVESVTAGPWQFTQTGTETYPAGIYIAVIHMGGNTRQIKLIKK